MTSIVLEIQEQIHNLKSLEDMGPLLMCIRESFDVCHVSYVATRLRGGAQSASHSTGKLQGGIGTWWQQPGQVAATTYSPQWSERYTQMNYVKTDPAVIGSMQKFFPVNWKELDWSTRSQRQLLCEAIDFGVGNQGYTVPLHGPDGHAATFVLNHNATDVEWSKFLRLSAGDILAIAYLVHHKILLLTDALSETASLGLSPRERAVLTYLAQGKTRSQAADKLMISEHTLRIYVDKARIKLGASNLSHAIALGIRCGVIDAG